MIIRILEEANLYFFSNIYITKNVVYFKFDVSIVDKLNEINIYFIHRSNKIIDSSIVDKYLFDATKSPMTVNRT